MKTGEHRRLLPLVRAQATVRLRLAVVLVHVAALRVVIRDAQIRGVLRRELLLEAYDSRELFEIVVGTQAVVRMVKSFHGITAVAVKAVLRRTLQPLAVAQIFRARREPK